MNFAGIDMYQISDGLTQTAASASAVVYDGKNGLVFVSYKTGLRQRYGESTGRICLSVFPPAQPWNIRHRIIDLGVGQSRGVLCTAHYLVGDGRTRMMFTTTRGELAAYYRDYDFFTDTVSERTEVFLRTKDGDVRLDNTTYRKCLSEFGYATESTGEPIINKVSRFGGELYTAVSVDSPFGYGILCRIEENILVPFAVCPEQTSYEFRYYINDEGIFAVIRIPPDDHKTGHGGYVVSRDGGKTWEMTVYADGVQSRPDILEYEGKPLMIYNYKNDRSTENFPPMHNFRNSIKFVHDGRVILDLFSKYGFVEHETVSICGDLYMAVSNCPQALSTENGAAWIEDGRPVEQGKEAIQWIKLGYLLGEEAEIG
ncbi:MAG: hypothetical protein IJP11_03265 [Oscillospiraceae bacterium]|nr:hypothetical protein [Oscillospiraceae bacterium]